MSDALLVGATGLVGSMVAAQYPAEKLAILARRSPVVGVAGPGWRVAPVDQWCAVVAQERPQVLISCLGTTIRAAGSQAAFRAVDHDLVLAVAGAARRAGARRMIAVSSVGASSASRNFYLRTKGEVEDALRALDFDCLDLLRPGLLTGDRQGPLRIGERLAAIAAPFTDAALHGGLRRYRSIPAQTVAAAIVALSSERGPGVYIHENDDIRALAD
ncbi:MAG: NAD(P)H-binding protein [Sphingopyxis sp.]|uniref:NAD(P)H-binding protein n=1 Tax=Sphingopyxis sp. TaxID=1908224 RepID=UPI002ABA532C|nr:NAD(P)H-binding protein [Sphingopyxis sp.]MDZ3832631.1 NAD(P)H-binding protein [Sphingopyxis sp.]